MADFETEIRSFVETQTNLVGALRASFGDTDEADWLSTIPTNGTILVDRCRWSFRRHGVGVAFEADSGIVIDVHVRIDDPHLFDAWRLRTYLGSLGRRGVRIVNRAAGTLEGPMEEKIGLCLSRLAAQGRIVETDGLFRLC